MKVTANETRHFAELKARRALSAEWVVSPIALTAETRSGSRRDRTELSRVCWLVVVASDKGGTLRVASQKAKDSGEAPVDSKNKACCERLVEDRTAAPFITRSTSWGWGCHLDNRANARAAST